MLGAEVVGFGSFVVLALFALATCVRWLIRMGEPRVWVLVPAACAAFAAAALLPSAARAQGLPAPPGSGWLWEPGSLDGSMIVPPPGFLLQGQRLGRYEGRCSEPVSREALFVSGSVEYVYAGNCWDDGYTALTADPSIGLWFRFVEFDPDAPSPPASSASASALGSAEVAAIAGRAIDVLVVGLSVLAFIGGILCGVFL